MGGLKSAHISLFTINGRFCPNFASKSNFQPSGNILRLPPATSGDLNFLCKWFNIVWNCLIQKISGFERIQNHPFFLYGRGHEISYEASIVHQPPIDPYHYNVTETMAPRSLGRAERKSRHRVDKQEDADTYSTVTGHWQNRLAQSL